MRALARLHAGFWDSPRLRTDLAWLKSRERNPRYRIERFLCAATLPRGVRRFGDLVPAPLQALVPRLIAARDALEDTWAEGPLTLVHGDVHAGNLYFLPGEVGFLDWQVVQRCQGMRDVSYFLANSIPTELRRRARARPDRALSRDAGRARRDAARLRGRLGAAPRPRLVRVHRRRRHRRGRDAAERGHRPCRSARAAPPPSWTSTPPPCSVERRVFSVVKGSLPRGRQKTKGTRQKAKTRNRP